MEMTPKTQTTKTKINKWDYIKIKITSVQQRKQQSKEATYGMGKMFINCIFDKGLISKTSKESL